MARTAPGRGSKGPVMTTLPPLTPEIAAAIRATWPKTMRKTYDDTPGCFTHCACQYGPTGSCERGRHDLCGRADALRACETTITRANFTVTHFPDRYHHPSDISAIGPRRTSAAQVWLADRVCRWECPCSCHAAPPAAPTAPEAPPSRVTAPASMPEMPGQLDLFDLMGHQ